MRVTTLRVNAGWRFTDRSAELFHSATICGEHASDFGGRSI